MAITKTTVDLLRAAWTQGVQEVLDRNIEITTQALIAATDPSSIAALQGKARAYQAMQKFPDYIANFIESKEEAPV